MVQYSEPYFFKFGIRYTDTDYIHYYAWDPTDRYRTCIERCISVMYSILSFNLKKKKISTIRFGAGLVPCLTPNLLFEV